MDSRYSNAFDAISTGVRDAVPARWRPLVARHPVRFAIIGLGVLAGLVWYLFFSTPPRVTEDHAIPVATAKVTVQDLPVSTTSLGAAQAWTSVTILAQVSGKLLDPAHKDEFR